MIDKNGKLFGKVNLIDLIIILVVLLVAGFFILRGTGVIGGGSDGETTQVRISFFGAEVPDFVVDYLHAGDSVYDHTEEVTLGTVESWETGEPSGYESVINGEVQEVSREGFVSVKLTILADAVMGEHGATIGGELYGVGHTLSLYAGQSKMYLKISAIEPVS